MNLTDISPLCFWTTLLRWYKESLFHALSAKNSLFTVMLLYTHMCTCHVILYTYIYMFIWCLNEEELLSILDVNVEYSRWSSSSHTCTMRRRTSYLRRRRVWSLCVAARYVAIDCYQGNQYTLSSVCIVCKSDWMTHRACVLQMIMYKNGISQGVAFENVFDGFYYPAVSFYKNSTVPHFAHFLWVSLCCALVGCKI